MKVCQKAIDKIEKRRIDDLNFSDCIKYRVCPKCGSDLAVKVKIAVYGIYSATQKLVCESEDCDFTFEK